MQENNHKKKLHHHAVSFVNHPTVKHIYVYVFFLIGFIVFGVGFIVIHNSFHQNEKEVKLPVPTNMPIVTASPTDSYSVSPHPVITQIPGQMCGGIAGKLCQVGYTCDIKHNYPDASGTCVKDPSAKSTDVSQDKIDFAIGDLASRLGVNKSTITVFSAQPREWTTGALGCPKPGFMYTESIVEGYEIVLSQSGTLYSYHGAGGTSSLCQHFNRE